MVMVDPLLASTLTRMGGSGPKPEVASRLMTSQGELTYFWDGHLSRVLVNFGQNRSNRFYQLTDTPMFEVEAIKLSQNSRWLALSGRQGITVVELPRLTGKILEELRENASEITETTVKSFGIGQRFLLASRGTTVLQVDWHPGSSYESHLVALTSDNQLRIFNVDLDQETPEQVIPLSPIGGKDYSMRSKLKASLGEVAVGFTFAPPVRHNTENNDNNKELEVTLAGLWPMFILHGNGDVFCLVTGLGESRPKSSSPLIGPLTMFPEASDNYGNESCSILCLHPLISSPPVLVIAANGGSIYHCVVLSRPASSLANLEDDNISLASDWSVLGHEAAPDVSLYVYESVELDLDLMGTQAKINREKGSDLFEYPILLHEDPTSPARYFASHSGGVHCVGLPMVTTLAELAQKPEEDQNLPPMEEPSLVEHLVCTKMTPSAEPAPILGLTVTHPPTRLLALTQDYSLQQLYLSQPYFGTPPPLLSNQVSDDSPLKNKRFQDVPFETKVAKMLQKSQTLPVIKAGTPGQISKRECLDITTRCTQILRSEYLSKQETVRSEIEKRSNQLMALKASQFKSVANLNSEKGQLRDKAATLSEQYEDLKDKTDGLAQRVEVVLQKIQAQLPMTSDAELRMIRTLKDLDRRTRDLKNGLEQIRSKDRYQKRQMEIQNKNLSQKSSGSEMGENQLKSIKEVLQTDAKEIAGLMAQINSARKDLAV